jgi:hypothetical protein
MLPATGLSAKTWVPVPIRRLIVVLAAFAVKTFFPALVVQQGAPWPASATDVKAPCRKSPSWLEYVGLSTPEGVGAPDLTRSAAGNAPTG